MGREPPEEVNPRVKLKAEMVLVLGGEWASEKSDDTENGRKSSRE